MKARDNIDYQYKVTQGKRRITFIGDSFTIGHGVKNVDERFANLIRKNNPELEIHVMAINGLETIDHLDLVKSLISQGYQFDLVILVYNLNDIAYLLPETYELYDRVNAHQKSLGFFGNNSYLINFLEARLFMKTNSGVGNYYDYLVPSYFNIYWTQQKQNLLELKATIEQAKGKLGVVTFPFLTQLNSDYKFTDVHEQLNQFWKSENVHHLDLFPIYQSYSDEDVTVNQNDPHPNELAHKLAAEEIQRYFIDPDPSK
ncbi:SGNH/GDSL hydrolase family protein [Aquimarina sp. 2201CG5-10]|uniref:SGNH/GDSL hydrolase family protein n=1 Tax=Aquimarina callyspongiae TaxID=3098150 RepID=UPI002AB353F4|nr:SGNH/GDSL hydrolase family protein [Aquimarina sp. 2201CG5-10]MDY8137479.1 SGNH/GDSL hydrolase family protein [Aquimarina sp. 2201CG5-10]